LHVSPKPISKSASNCVVVPACVTQVHCNQGMVAISPH
jgi:hypothetical protein